MGFGLPILSVTRTHTGAPFPRLRAPSLFSLPPWDLAGGNKGVGRAISPLPWGAWPYKAGCPLKFTNIEPSRAGACRTSPGRSHCTTIGYDPSCAWQAPCLLSVSLGSTTDSAQRQARVEGRAEKPRHSTKTRGRMTVRWPPLSLSMPRGRGASRC